MQGKNCSLRKQGWTENDLKNDSTAYSSFGLQIILPSLVIKKLYVSKIDVKSAFSQSRKAERNLFVK